MEEYKKLIEEIKVIVSDAKDMSASDKELLNKTLHVIKFICQQNALSRKLEAVSAPLEFRNELINSIDKKIEEYEKAKLSWIQGSQNSPIPFESAMVDEYQKSIDRLQELRGRVVANNYLDDIQSFVSSKNAASEKEYAKLLIECANRLAVDYYTIPQVSGEYVVNIPHAPFSVNEQNFSGGFSQHQNIGQILSKDAIHFMLRFLENKEELQKIYDASELLNSSHALNGELSKQESENARINYCIDNVDEFLHLHRLVGYTGDDRFFEFERKCADEKYKLHQEISFSESTILRKLLNRKRISALSQRSEELDNLLNMLNKKDSELRVDYLFDYFGKFRKSVDKEAVVSELKKKMYDTDKIKQEIQSIEERLQACIDSMDPETKELYTNQYGLCYIISKYYGKSKYRGDGHYKTSGYIGQPIMVSLLALKVLCDSYGIDTSMEITEEMQQEFDALATQFETLISKKDNYYKKEYDEIASLQATDYPVTR